MAYVRLTQGDCSLLCCLTDIDSWLGVWIDIYTFIQRAAVPTYEALAGCIERATAAGVMAQPTDGLYRLTPEWQARREEIVAEVRDGTLGRFEFAEWLEAQTLAATGSGGFILSRDEYDRAVRQCRARRG